MFTWIYDVLEWVAHFPFVNQFIVPFAWWQWLLFGIMLWVAIKSIRGTAWVFIAFILSVFVKAAPTLENDELNVVLLDVGQGLAMVIETPNSVTVYDTGPRYGSGFTAADAVLLPYLRYRGINKIDTLVISHADNDHIGGYETLRNAFEIGQTLTSRVDKIPSAQECQRGQSWMHDQTSFTVLSPDNATPRGSNNHSCVILIEHLGTKVLLSGDIEKQVERYLVNQSQLSLSANILLVPHQGSKTSSTTEFLNAVNPQMAMLAAGYKNHYGHPHVSVVDRYREHGIELLSTIKSGSILLKINSHGWRKVSYRDVQRRFWHYQK